MHHLFDFTLSSPSSYEFLRGIFSFEKKMKEKAKERKTADRGRRVCAHSSGEGILDSDLGNGFIPEAQRGLSEIKKSSEGL